MDLITSTHFQKEPSMIMYAGSASHNYISVGSGILTLSA